MRFWFFAGIFLYWSLQSVAQNVRTYEKNNLYGLADSFGKPLTDALYSEIQVGTDYSIVRLWNKAKAIYLTGTIDQKGKIVIEPGYVDLKRDGLRLISCRKVNQTFKYGLLLINGEEVIPASFLSVQSLGAMRYAVENDEHKFAIYTDKGINLTGFTIENLTPIKPNLIQFNQNGLLGLLDRQGNIVKEAQYTEIHIHADTIIGLLPQQWELTSLADFKTTSIEAQQVQLTLSGNLIIHKEKNKAQLYTTNLQPFGKIYPALSDTDNRLYFIAKETGKYFIVDKEGKQVTTEPSDSIIVQKNFAWIKKDKHWKTFLLQQQKFNIDKFDSFRKLNEYSIVSKQKFEGLVNANGEEIIPCVYDSILTIKENLLTVKLKNLYGIINLQEKWLLPPQPFRINLVNKNLYLLTQGKLQYLKNFEHKILYFTNNTLRIQNEYIEETTSRGEKWKIDEYGVATSLMPKVSNTFQQILLPTEGYAAIKKDNRWGFIDMQGRLRIANRYDSVLSFTFGTAAFKLRKKWGLLNKEDKIVMQPVYDSVTRTSENTMIVFQKKAGGIIKPTGEELLPLRFDAVTPWLNNYYLLRKEKNYGWADANGNLVVEPKYQNIKPAGKFLAAKILNSWGLVNWDGSQKIPAIYTNCEISSDGEFILMSKEIKTDIITLKQDR
jgi:hypothetical protein